MASQVVPPLQRIFSLLDVRHVELMQVPGCGKVELGATWFHGIHGNPLYEHAVQLGLMNRETSELSGESAVATAALE